MPKKYSGVATLTVFMAICIAVVLITTWHSASLVSQLEKEPSFSISNRGPNHSFLYRMKVVIFTQKRLEGLQMVWNSLKKASYPRTDIPIDITVMIDATDNVNAMRDIEDFLVSQRWDHGRLDVVRRVKKAGLKAAILEGWFPASDNEFALLLEDDVEVSPQWFNFVDAAIRKYYNFNGENDNRFFGISLFNTRMNGFSKVVKAPERPYPPTPYLLQQPCSWGGVYFPRVWREFRKWIREYQGDPIVPLDLKSNSWSKKSSWKKYLTLFMYEKDGYMLYPNPANWHSFSANHRLKGVHEYPREKSQHLVQHKLVTHPFNASILPQWEHLWLSDMEGRLVQPKNVPCSKIFKCFRAKA